eukprot:3143456-Prymnesium_polylepis.1
MAVTCTDAAGGGALGGEGGYPRQAPMAGNQAKEERGATPAVTAADVAVAHEQLDSTTRLS